LEVTNRKLETLWLAKAAFCVAARGTTTSTIAGPRFATTTLGVT
jgi:hypothetical protein